MWTTELGKTAATNFSSVVWNKFKNGTKNRVYLKTLNVSQYY